MAIAYNGTEPYIFISYSHKDMKPVVEAVDTLIDNGFRVWYDNGIEAGTEWPEYIAERLMSSQVVIAFMSRNSQDSHNCRREIHFAIELKKELLVVYLEDFELSPGMRLQLSALQAMFKYKYASEADYLSHLCNAAIIRQCKAPIEVPEPMVIEKPEDIESFISDEPIATEENPADEGSFDDLISQAFKSTGVNDTIDTSVDNEMRAIDAALIACNSDSSKKSFYFKRPDKVTQKQLDNSVSAIAKGKIKKSDIIALMDDTVRGNGKSGYIVTRDHFYSGGTGILSTNFNLTLIGLKSVELRSNDHLILTYNSGEKLNYFFSIYAPYFEVFFKTYIQESNK